MLSKPYKKKPKSQASCSVLVLHLTRKQDLSFDIYMVDQSNGTYLVLKILSRMPSQNVGRCRLALKECKDLTFQSYFLYLHPQRT